MPVAVSHVALLLFAAEKSFWHEHGDEISAAITLVVAILIAFLVDRLVIGRGSRVADRISDKGVSRAAQTRLRVIRRLVFLAILVIGAALALSQFGQIKRLATGILASSAVIGLVVGFAARQTIGNMVAGVQLAITQPMRIGDRISFEDVTGRVDDVTLSYTYIDPGDGDLVVIPNEQLAGGIVFNHSTGDRNAPITALAWLPRDSDLGRVEEVLTRDVGVDSVQLVEWTAEAVAVEVKIAPDAERTRVGDEEAALRMRALRALQRAGLLSGAASSSSASSSSA